MREKKMLADAKINMNWKNDLNPRLKIFDS